MTWKVVLGELELVRGVGVVGDLRWGLIVAKQPIASLNFLPMLKFILQLSNEPI